MKIIMFLGSLVPNPAKIFFFGYNVELVPTNDSKYHIPCAADRSRSMKIHFRSKKSLWETFWQSWVKTFYLVFIVEINTYFIICINLKKSISFAICFGFACPFQGGRLRTHTTSTDVMV